MRRDTLGKLSLMVGFPSVLLEDRKPCYLFVDACSWLVVADHPWLRWGIDAHQEEGRFERDKVETAIVDIDFRFARLENVGC